MMKLLRRSLLLLATACSLALQPAGAQVPDSAAVTAVKEKQPYLIGLSQLGGFIISHSPRMKHLASTHPMGLELNLQRQTTGEELWHGLYKYPKVGVSLIWFDYHNPIMGHSFAVSPFINKSFYRSQRQEINFRIGTGLAYFTNRFDIRNNHKNTIVSSSFNAVLQTRFEYDLKLTEHLSLLASLGLNHYSNGATSKPNLGINIPTASLGLNYYTNRSYVPGPKQEAEEFRPFNFLDLSTSIGYKQLTESNRQRYLVNSVSVVGGRQVNRKSSLVAGLEGFYDRSLLEQQLLDSALVDKDKATYPDVKRLGLMVGHELLLGRIAFVTHLGVYVYRPYKWDTFYYERLGLRYYFSEHLWGGVELKVHRGSADVIEWKVGVRL